MAKCRSTTWTLVVLWSFSVIKATTWWEILWWCAWGATPGAPLSLPANVRNLDTHTYTNQQLKGNTQARHRKWLIRSTTVSLGDSGFLLCSTVFSFLVNMISISTAAFSQTPVHLEKHLQHSDYNSASQHPTQNSLQQQWVSSSVSQWLWQEEHLLLFPREQFESKQLSGKDMFLILNSQTGVDRWQNKGKTCFCELLVQQDNEYNIPNILRVNSYA